jgi:hypothetical protein
MVSNGTVITIVIAICATLVSSVGIIAAVLSTPISDVRDLQRDLRDFKSEVSAALAKINGHGA